MIDPLIHWQRQIQLKDSPRFRCSEFTILPDAPDGEVKGEHLEVAWPATSSTTGFPHGCRALTANAS